MDVGTGDAPPADVGGERDVNNEDTYEPDDDNFNSNVQD